MTIVQIGKPTVTILVRSSDTYDAVHAARREVSDLYKIVRLIGATDMGGDWKSVTFQVKGL